MDTSRTLDFEFMPDPDLTRRRDGWGAGKLTVDGKPYWYARSLEEPSPIDWTWVDVLEHIAEAWPSLVARQSYPFEWLDKAASDPGKAWALAERRWATRGEALASEEEPALLDFFRTHNLAAAWKGMALPSLIWLRVGDSVWLSPEDGEPIRASYDQCRASLQALGDQLAEAFSGSENARVASAVEAWQSRADALRESYVALATGLSGAQLTAIQRGQRSDDFWEISADNDWTSGRVRESALLAAARMTRGVLSPASIKSIVERIRRAPKLRTVELDQLSVAASSHLLKLQSRYAHESGYDLAEWMREHLKIGLKRYIDIAQVLQTFKVQVDPIDLETDRIDALAFWGSHGPCVYLNTARAYASNSKRTRMILAHELCHLLIDRSSALPVAEVLGGAIDQYVEKRANAFAAELLLPRDQFCAEWLKLRQRRLSDLLTVLAHDYGVSNSVAYAQIYNSGVFPDLGREEQDRIEKYLREGDNVYLWPKAVSEVV